MKFAAGDRSQPPMEKRILLNYDPRRERFRVASPADQLGVSVLGKFRAQNGPVFVLNPRIVVKLSPDPDKPVKPNGRVPALPALNDALMAFVARIGRGRECMKRSR